MGEEAGTIDLLLLGDSEVGTGFAPGILWRDFGITSYNCSTGAMELPEAEYMMRQFFRQHQPRVVVLQINAGFQELGYYDLVSAPLEDALPLLFYHDRWKHLTARDLRPAQTPGTHREDFRGYYFSNTTQTMPHYDYMQPNDQLAHLPGKSRLLIQRMKAFCDENQAELVLLATTSVYGWSMDRHNAAAALAQSMRVDFWDCNTLPDALALQWEADYRDDHSHPNYRGATKLTAQLGKLLQEKALPDHRSDPAYASWQNTVRALEKADAIPNRVGG